MTIRNGRTHTQRDRDPRYDPSSPEFDPELWACSQGLAHDSGCDRCANFQHKHWRTGQFVTCSDDPGCDCWVSPSHCHRCHRPVSGPGALCPSFNNCL